MKRYAVELTATALTEITKQARFIAAENHQPANAKRWLESVWDTVDSLEHLPGRAPLAAENDYVDYEVRQFAVGSQLLLFSIDGDRGKVWIIGLRGARQLPRPQDLPRDLENLEAE